MAIKRMNYYKGNFFTQRIFNVSRTFTAACAKSIISPFIPPAL